MVLVPGVYWRERFLSGPLPDDHGSLGEAGTMPSSCVSLRMLRPRCSHLESGALFPWTLYLAVIVPGVWVLLFSKEKLDFTGDVCFRGRNAWFDSGYMFCDRTLVAMDELHTFSTLRRTRILKCCSPFSCRTEKPPSRCSWLQLCSAQFALGKREVLLELHVADTSDDGKHFSQLGAAFSAVSSELRPAFQGHANSSQRLVDKDIPTEGATETTTTTTKQTSKQPPNNRNNT